MNDYNVGRGEVAVADMKARIAALRAQGVEDVVAVLWERSFLAERGSGYRYEYADPPTG